MKAVLRLLLTYYLVVVQSLDSTVRGSAHRKDQQLQRRVGTILKLRLINADTDEPIAAYDPLPEMSIIDVSLLPTTNLNVQAITDGNVKSIQWSHNGIVHTENRALWSLCGNSGDDFKACPSLNVGVNTTIQATPFSGMNAAGRSGGSVLTNIALVTRSKDTMPPKLIGFTVSSTKVDITSGSGLMQVQITVQDDQSGMDSTVIGIPTQYAKWSKPLEFFPGQPTGKNKISYNGTLSFSSSMPTGNYPLFVQLRDKEYNVLDLDSVGLAKLNFPSNIDIVKTNVKAPKASPVAPPRPAPAPVADSTPPKLIGLAVSSTKVDISSGSGSMQVQITVQDDQSGMDSTVIGIPTEYAKWSIPLEFFPGRPTGKNKISYNGTLKFSSSMPIGNYPLFVQLRDKQDNVLDLNSVGLAKLNFPSNIDIVKTNVKAPKASPVAPPRPAPAPVADTTPPKLIGLTVSSNKVDISSGSGSMQVQITVQDDQSGMDSTVIGIPTEYAKWSIPLEFFPGRPTGKNKISYNGTLKFSSSMPTGNYPLFVQLRDKQYNVLDLNSVGLAKLNFPANIDIVKTKAPKASPVAPPRTAPRTAPVSAPKRTTMSPTTATDTTPPKLISFTVSKTKVNVTSGQDTVQVQITVQDDRSGMDSTALGIDTNFAKWSQPLWFYPGRNTGKSSITYNGTLRFSTDMFTGTYPLFVNLRDTEYNTLDLDSSALEKLKFPSSIYVVSSK